ncbi:MAG: YeeE/YedE family protein [bacterium]|nr:MAG: YeeE/YedE family protein [bacterium]
MLDRLHTAKGAQRTLGLAAGIAFGFLLQKGGATDYGVIMGQLLLTDFTVVKIMVSAVITGMLGVHLLRSLGFARLHPKQGSLGSSALGGLIFGVGFGLLGYCPGTAAGAVGEGRLDALFGGVVGILLGAWIFAALFPRLRRSILNWCDFGEMTFPELLRTGAWNVVIPAALLLAGFLLLLERTGL